MPKKSNYATAQLHELLYQALETQNLGYGVKIYETGGDLRSQCIDLKKGMVQEYLKQTRHHVDVVRNIFSELGLDHSKMTPPGRQVVAHIGSPSLVKSCMEMAKANGDAAAAQMRRRGMRFTPR